MAKRFDATQALRCATLEIRAGEVQALIGENGSGKSTLVKILAGVHRPDSGDVVIGDAPVDLRRPSDALAAGVATVFQEVLVVASASVLDNVFLGTEGLLRRRLSDRAKRDRANQVLGALLGSPPPLDVPAGSLSLSDRQACCIARALVRDPAVLVLDEATSALDVATRGRLFGLLAQMTAAGGAVVFISHRMDEISEIADRVTVMRSGDTVATLDRDDARPDVLVSLMTGQAHRTPDRAHRTSAPCGAVVLHARDLRLRPGAVPIDLDVRAGEIVGLAGLEGHGQDKLLRALAGAADTGGGEVQCDGVPITSDADAAQRGIAYVPRERRAESLFESKSVLENFALPTLGRDVRRGLLSWRVTRERLAVYTDRLRIVVADPDDPITSLSGGNQQKVIMARWLAADPRVLLLNDPTRGVDLGAKRDLYQLLRELAGDGLAIVMLSTEIDEHVELMDRVLVLREHSVVAEIDRVDCTAVSLVGAFFGGAHRA